MGEEAVLVYDRALAPGGVSESLAAGEKGRLCGASRVVVCE